MGTNYYAVIETQNQLTESELGYPVNHEWITPPLGTELIKNIFRVRAIHIGKKSWGWAFHFHGHQSSKWFNSPSTWFKFLRDFQVTIVDEYGTVIPLSELSDIVFKWGHPDFIPNDDIPEQTNLDHIDYCLKNERFFTMDKAFKSEGYSFTTTYFS